MEAAKEVLWAGTPSEGYYNIAIANVDDNLNIRSEASTSSKLVGKLRPDSACDIVSQDGEWVYIKMPHSLASFHIGINPTNR